MRVVFHLYDDTLCGAEPLPSRGQQFPLSTVRAQQVESNVGRLQSGRGVMVLQDVDDTGFGGLCLFCGVVWKYGKRMERHVSRMIACLGSSMILMFARRVWSKLLSSSPRLSMCTSPPTPQLPLSTAFIAFNDVAGLTGSTRIEMAWWKEGRNGRGM